MINPFYAGRVGGDSNELHRRIPVSVFCSKYARSIREAALNTGFVEPHPEHLRQWLELWIASKEIPEHPTEFEMLEKLKRERFNFDRQTAEHLRLAEECVPAQARSTSKIEDATQVPEALTLVELKRRLCERLPGLSAKAAGERISRGHKRGKVRKTAQNTFVADALLETFLQNQQPAQPRHQAYDPLKIED